ncbi:Flagellar protein FlgJ [Spirochaeta thermophila DSM 6578]|uniref:Flagellar protein FlgJ n=1 Tax=Winmispira thermophila (strain ATCC 700085 / DSM 6578 / Z-1203) TaxID=869211 RepID=G0GA03_WINT7|nr:rod-binding protein [Spirochaeta thermophila]AEJ61691.1 Flagellar protein FlgJ [Spirochaeta thermophila DSM 6578]
MINPLDLYKIVDTSVTPGLPRKEDPKLKEATEEFEALFVKMMVDQMRKGVPRSGLLEKNMAEEVFEDMLYDEYARLMAKSTRFGLAEMLYKELSG